MTLVVAGEIHRHDIGDLATAGSRAALTRMQGGCRVSESGRKLLLGFMHWAGMHLQGA
jgi:hypothetical protein